MTDLRISMVQAQPEWENPARSLGTFQRLLSDVGDTDLIILPEMFTTGFSMNVAALAEKSDGPTVQWMTRLAADKQAAVVGSVIIEEEGRYFNRLIWATPDGALQGYDKRHLFSMGEEHRFFTPGNQRLVVNWKGWRMAGFICYDLRFPVWCRNRNDYDLLVFSANWPQARHLVWKNLLVARALENQAFCAGVNCSGQDGLGLTYAGDSAFVTPKGEAVFVGSGEKVVTFSASLEELQAFRQKFPALNDRDEFEVFV